MSKYIDESGLNYLWGKVKSYVSGLGFYTKPTTGIPATDIASGVIPTVPTALSSFTDDLGSSPTHTHSQYLTSAPVTSVNGQTGAVTVSSASPTSTVPAMDGVAAVGSETTFAKGDHVHPSDTSREARVTTVSHGTSNTTFALTPNVLHTWGTVNSLTLSLASGSSTYVDGYWFKFTAGSSFTSLTMPSGVSWAKEPDIESGKTYEVMIVDNFASYVTDAESGIVIDSALSTGSTSPVQNKAITNALNTKVASSDITTIVVIDESSYNDLATKDSGTLYLIPES